MNLLRRGGFTLIELMVSLVVGGLLMATLVAFSGAVRKSFSRSKDVTELQANLRFGMKVLVDDLSRVAYRSSSNPSMDTMRWSGLPPDPAWGLGAALDPIEGQNRLQLTGNYLSARDYQFKAATLTLLCNDGWDFRISEPLEKRCQPRETEGLFSLLQGENLNHPFFDGSVFEGIFIKENILFFRTAGKVFGSWHKITAVDKTTYTIQVDPPINQDQNQGDELWVSLISRVSYQVAEHTPGVWTLDRMWTDVLGDHTMEAAEYLLPIDDVDAPGLEIMGVFDWGAPTNPLVTGGYWLTNIDFESKDRWKKIYPVDERPTDEELLKLRALVVTLRGRIATEEPGFVLGNYSSDPAIAKNYGYDLDGDPDNGLARVRVESTVVNLHNMSAGQHGQF